MNCERFFTEIERVYYNEIMKQKTTLEMKYSDLSISIIRITQGILDCTRYSDSEKVWRIKDEHILYNKIMEELRNK